MLGRLTRAVVFISAILFSIPVYAESWQPSLQPTAETEPVPPAKQDLESVPKAAGSAVESPNLRYFQDYFIDTGRIVTAPLHWETKDWVKLGLVLGTTSTLFLVDEKVKDFAQGNQSSAAAKFASVGNFVGDPLYLYPSLGSFYLYGYLAKDSKARRASLLALESLTITGVFTAGLKMLASRHRPNSGHSPTDWDGPGFSTEYVSFSSGHTASAFAVATVLADEYKDNAFVPPIAYGLATLTGLSRIYSNEHWSSDAFFGGALGYAVSKAVLRFHKKDDKLGNRLSIIPEVGKEMTGLTVNYQF